MEKRTRHGGSKGKEIDGREGDKEKRQTGVEREMRQSAELLFISRRKTKTKRQTH